MSEHEKAAEHPAITKLRAVEWRFAGGDASAVGTIALTGKEEAEREVRTLIAELEAVDVALRDCGFPEAPTRAERLRLASNAAECNADALALSPRQLVREPSPVLGHGESDERQQLRHPPLPPGGRPSLESRHDAHVPGHGEVRQQADLLDHVPDGAAQANGIPGPRLPPLDHHGPRRGLQHPVDDPKCGGLPGATPAKQDHPLARGHGQRNRADQPVAVTHDFHVTYPYRGDRSHGSRTYPGSAPPPPDRPEAPLTARRARPPNPASPASARFPSGSRRTGPIRAARDGTG